MTDPFDDRMRRNVRAAVLVPDDPALAEHMAVRAMTADRHAARPRMMKTFAVLASSGAVAATAVVVTLIAAGHDDKHQAPGNQPTRPVGTCTPRPSVPPVTASPGLPTATLPAPAPAPSGHACSPASSPPTGAGTASAVPTYHS